MTASKRVKQLSQRMIQLPSFLMLLALFSCSWQSDFRYLDSDQFDNKEERVAALEKEIQSYSKIEDAAFELFNVNGFSNRPTLIPGASSWDYKFVVRVPTSKVDAWTEGLIQIKTDQCNLQWMQEIVKENPNDWRTNTAPEYYIAEANEKK